MREVVVSSLLTKYIDQGSGPDILLLHGWGDSAQTFQKIIEDLSRNYRVVAPDLPGFGGTQIPASPWDLTDYAHFIEQFCSKVSCKPHTVIGHSNGGAIAIRGVASGSINPKKLVLLAASGVRDKGSLRKKTLRMLAVLAKPILATLPHTVKTNVRKKLYRKIGSDLLVVQDMQETFKKIVADDVQHDASAVHIPVLLLYGIEDTATPFAYGELLASKIDNAKLVKANAGHFIHHDQPALVSKYIQEFIRE